MVARETPQSSTCWHLLLLKARRNTPASSGIHQSSVGRYRNLPFVVEILPLLLCTLLTPSLSPPLLALIAPGLLACITRFVYSIAAVNELRERRGWIRWKMWVLSRSICVDFSGVVPNRHRPYEYNRRNVNTLRRQRRSRLRCILTRTVHNSMFPFCFTNKGRIVMRKTKQNAKKNKYVHYLLPCPVLLPSCTPTPEYVLRMLHSATKAYEAASRNFCSGVCLYPPRFLWRWF